MSNSLQITIFKILGFLAQAAGIISIIMLVFSLLSVVMSIKKERPLTKKRLIQSVILSLASLAVFLYFSKLTIELKQWLIFGGAGLGIGYYWATTIKVYAKEGKVFNKNTLLYAVVWGGTFALSQLFANLKADYVNAAILSSILSAGIVVGMNGMLFKKYLDSGKKQTQS